MPPYPGIPYGKAPSWCFPVFEISMYLLFLLCLAFAIKRGRRDVAYLLGGLAFGLILEYVEVISAMGYTYGRFMIMFGKAPLDIPLCIGVGWGIIMYTARLFSDSLGLTLWACAALDTLLAINIDLSMDTVAYRLHMWHWDWSGTNHNPLTAQWFGIPYGNFFGWQMVVFFYSAFSRLFERTIARRETTTAYKFVLTAIMALLCSQILLYVMEAWGEAYLHKQFGITSFHRFIGFMLFHFILVGWGWKNRKIPVQARKIPEITWWVPGWFHLFFFACLFLAGFYTENKWMTLAACLNLLVGILIHIMPFSFKRRQTKIS